MTEFVKEVRPGNMVRVSQKVKEGDKERIQIFEGRVLRIRGSKPESRTLLVRKESYGVGVERNFPLSSRLITKIEIVKKTRTRQARPYYLRVRKFE